MDMHYCGKRDPNPQWSEKLDPDPHDSQNSGALKGSKMEPWTLTIEAWKLKREPWRVCRPVVADLHHFDEENVPFPHLSRTGSSIEVQRWIRIRMKVMRIRNPATDPCTDSKFYSASELRALEYSFLLSTVP
jgi:hypothetical protein